MTRLAILLLIIGVVLYFTLAPGLGAALIVVGIILLLVAEFGGADARWPRR